MREPQTNQSPRVCQAATTCQTWRLTSNSTGPRVVSLASTSQLWTWKMIFNHLDVIENMGYLRIWWLINVDHPEIPVWWIKSPSTSHFFLVANFTPFSQHLRQPKRDERGHWICRGRVPGEPERSQSLGLLRNGRYPKPRFLSELSTNGVSMVSQNGWFISWNILLSKSMIWGVPQL